MFMTRSLNVTPKTTEQCIDLTACSNKSVAYVTNNKRLYSMFCTVEANYYWQTRRFARPLCDSRTTCKTMLSLQRRAPNTCTWDFSDVIKVRVAAHTTLEKAIWFRHPDYNLDRAHATFHPNPCTRFWVIFLTDRQTDRQTNTGKNIYFLLCRR